MKNLSDCPTFTKDSVTLLNAAQIFTVQELSLLRPEALTEILNSVIEKQSVSLRVKMSHVTGVVEKLPTDAPMLSRQLIEHAKMLLKSEQK